MMKNYQQHFRNTNLHIFNERLGQIQLPKVQVFSISERLTVKTSIFLYIFTPNLSPSYNVLELKHVLE